ncbi:MAG TPA: cobalamin biosynthesis protein CbiD [Syntrophaceae bacterium]|nr:cobalamin biosynthesis protein CbiD [Syntrophaceae bacterium]HCX01470.1 cobalamin biosynthesis protein CbiD [Syntrophaceae bacterium]
MTALRLGYTTGACAAAAAWAAAELLENGQAPSTVAIALPGGEQATLPVLYSEKKNGVACAAIRKDAGDDPDVTNGVTVVASVAYTDGGDVVIAGGEGVGVATKRGLSVAVGEAAINPVPQAMIREAVRRATLRGVQVTISIPGGEALAEKTFNPRLGIKGGLSILGTSGRVRPFSCGAIKESLRCQLNVAANEGVRRPVLVPGRIGERAATRHFQIADGQMIEVGNEWGLALDVARSYAFEELLVLGHPGKLAKLAAGDWDTHSSRSASPLSWLSQMASEIAGRALFKLPTVEGVVSVLAEDERRRFGVELAGRIRSAVICRTGNKIKIAVVLINMHGDILGGDGDTKSWT